MPRFAATLTPTAVALAALSAAAVALALRTTGLHDRLALLAGALLGLAAGALVALAIGLRVRRVLLAETERRLDAERRLHEQAAAEQARRELVEYDPVTGLPYADRFEQLVEERRAAAPYSMLMIQVERLGEVVLALGHEARDELLRALAQRMADNGRAGDVGGRWSADRLALCLVGLTAEDDVLAVGDRLRRALTEPLMLGGQALRPVIALGGAVSHRGGRSGQRLLRDAALALEHARATGAAEVVLYRASLQVQRPNALRLESELRRALEQVELRVYYQPIIDLPAGTVGGFEALVRWAHPERGLVPPLDFIPVAEASDLIIPLGAFVLEEACRQFGRWQRAGLVPIDASIAVNVSARQLSDPLLVETVDQALRTAGLAARDLKLEITETAVMGDPEAAIAVLQALREKGVHISVDDFGTGYSSLSYLRRIPLDVLKIDRAFVRDLTRDDAAAALIRGILELAHALGLSVVAEGIDDALQIAALEEMGCDAAQGFYYARPMPADQAETWLLEQAPRLALRGGATVH